MSCTHAYDITMLTNWKPSEPANPGPTKKREKLSEELNSTRLQTSDIDQWQLACNSAFISVDQTEQQRKTVRGRRFPLDGWTHPILNQLEVLGEMKNLQTETRAETNFIPR